MVLFLLTTNYNNINNNENNNKNNNNINKNNIQERFNIFCLFTDEHFINYFLINYNSIKKFYLSIEVKHYQ